MDELVDRFELARNRVDSFFMDLMNGTNQEFVDEAFKVLDLNKADVENKLIRINEEVNPFNPEQMWHNASKKIIYKAILTMMWEDKMADNTSELG